MDKNDYLNFLSQIKASDSFKQRTIQKMQQAISSNSKPHKRFSFVKVPIAVCMISITTFGTVFAFSQDFRTFIISFIKSDQIETPITPLTSDSNKGNEHQQGIHYLGQQEITDIAEINYYQFNYGFEIYDNTIAAKTEGSKIIIYKLNGKVLTKLPQNEVNDVIHIRGLNIPLRFVYVIDGGMIKTFDNVYDKASGGQATAVWSLEGDYIWVNIAIRDELGGTYNTYLLYNLKTGTTRDLISDAGIEVTPKTEVIISPDGKTLLVNNLHRVYVINAESSKMHELPALYSPSHKQSVSFIDNETLSVWQFIGSEEIHYSIYSYNIANGKKTTICENTPGYSPLTATGVRGLGNGMTILVEPKQYVLIDEKSGIRYPIEGLKPDSRVDFLLGPDRGKVLVTTITGQKGLGITQIGYIDIENQTLKVFERKDFTNYETSMHWISNNEVAVMATDKNEYLYVYKFK
jgi:hypothetical protein